MFPLEGPNLAPVDSAPGMRCLQQTLQAMPAEVMPIISAEKALHQKKYEIFSIGSKMFKVPVCYCLFKTEVNFTEHTINHSKVCSVISLGWPGVIATQ